MKSILIPLVLTLSLSACSHNAKPQTSIAHYTGTVVSAVTELQKGITAATDAKVLPVATAQKLTSYSEILYDKSGKLLTALQAYNTLTDVKLKQVKAGEVQGLLAEVNTVLSQVLGTSLPPGAVSSINSLVGNVIQAVGLVQAELAKGL